MSIKWYQIAEHVNEIPFGTNHIAVVEANGKKICVAKSGNDLFAFSYKCPHAGGILAEGHIDATGKLVCPLHRYRFDMKNGRNTSGEGYYLKHWPVELRGDKVFVGMEEAGGLFGWLRK